MLITFGFNDSDNTVGWKLYKNAMTMYYLHPTQKFIQEEHSFPLVPGLERVHECPHQKPTQSRSPTLQVHLGQVN